MNEAAILARGANYLLTPEEVEFFDTNGYLVLRNRVPADLLARAREAAAYWIENGRDAEDSTDYGFANRPTGRVMFRVNYVHAKGHRGSLELLGCPEILGIAESLAGPDFVPTYESLVFKEAGDGAPIAWHQDAVHERRYRNFNIDIYLDPSLSGQGALRVVPGSQLDTIDACAVAEEFGWNIPGAIEVEMEPGDILVHDVMVVHGSEPTLGNPLRRTIYYAFHPAEQILNEGPWDAQWVDARLRLIPLALDAHAAAFPEHDQYAWHVSDSLRPVPHASIDEELRTAHAVHFPGSYCHPGTQASGRAAPTAGS